MDPTPVDRCVCRQVLFADLLRLHRATGARLDELRTRTGCGTGCGLCVPYIRAALATGRERLPILSHEELRRLAGDGSQ